MNYAEKCRGIDIRENVEDKSIEIYKEAQKNEDMLRSDRTADMQAPGDIHS